MAKTRRNGRKRCGGSRKPKYNMKGCASKCRGMSKAMRGGDRPIAPMSVKQMNALKGGSCPSCAIPSSYSSILGIGQTGGCTSCMRGGGGGSFYKTDLAPVVPPFVGKAWGPLVAQWPGVDGVDSGRNFFTNNLYKVDPQTMMKLGGKGKKGKRMNKKSRRSKSVCNGVCGPDCNCKQSPEQCNCSPKCQCGCQKRALKGGSILPDFVGLGRDLMYNFQSTYNSLNGYNQPMNPKPYIQPALSSTKPM